MTGELGPQRGLYAVVLGPSVCAMHAYASIHGSYHHKPLPAEVRGVLAKLRYESDPQNVLDQGVPDLFIVVEPKRCRASESAMRGLEDALSGIGIPSLPAHDLVPKLCNSCPRNRPR